MAWTRVPARARGGSALKPKFFATPEKEVLVGFYKNATGKP